MRKSLVVFSGLLFALAIALIAPTSMRADTFQISVLGLDFSGSFTVNATADGGNEYTATPDSGTGTFVSALGPTSVTGVLDAGTFKNNDNSLFYPGNGVLDSEFFDSHGLAFQLADGYYIDLSNDGILDVGAAGMPDSKHTITQFDIVDVYPTSPAATPEPSSLLLLGTTLLGAAGIARRKFLRA